MSRFRSSELMPGLEKTSSLRAKVARSASSRPAGRISANVVRRSLECGTRFMRLCSSSRSTALVTLVGWTCRRAPILLSGSAPRAR